MCRPAVRPIYFDLLTHCFYDAPQSVESLWASDQPVAETTHNTHNRQTSMPWVGLVNVRVKRTRDPFSPQPSRTQILFYVNTCYTPIQIVTEGSTVK